MAIAKPNTITPLTLTAAFKAATGGRFGVVRITTNKYIIIETDPAINPLFNAFLLTDDPDINFNLTTLNMF
jgi:hypothetical protein